MRLPLQIEKRTLPYLPFPAATFDALSAVGSAIRGVDKPFGGIQL